MPAKEAHRRGITGDAYNAAVLERSDFSKYYEDFTTPTGETIRRRRRDVYPPSLHGLYRPVYSESTENDPSSPVLFYER